MGVLRCQNRLFILEEGLALLSATFETVEEILLYKRVVCGDSKL